MRRMLAVLLVVVVSLSCFSVAVSATEIDSHEAGARLMPAAYKFTDSITLTPDKFPPGTANFDVVISGQYDLQGDNVISIDVKQCTYRGGINCTEHNMSVTAYKSTGTNGYILWKLTGTLTFSWESPVTGHNYETVYLESPLYSFYVSDYVA